MDDSNDINGVGDIPDVNTAALYLETLKARMAPEQFATLEQALHEFQQVIKGGGNGEFQIDEGAFDESVRKELMTVVAMAGTGRTDHQIVEVPWPDGSPGFAAVSAEVGNDPVKLAEVRAELHAWVREHWDAEEERLLIGERSQGDQGGPAAVDPIGPT